MEADGQPISIPFDFHSRYPYIEREYIAAPSVFDWNGDGIADLMIGGYLTGLVFREIEIFATWSSGQIKLLKQLATGWEGSAISTPWIPYPHPIVMDIAGSGQADLILSGSYGFVHLLRRAFVEYGYNEGRVEIHPPGKQR